MLAQILNTNAASTAFDIAGFISAFSASEGYLIEGDSAQFAAGSLYAASNQYIDKRAYLVGCSKHDDELDQLLEDAFAAFNKGDTDTGTSKINDSEDHFETSMKSCSDTNDYF